MLDVSRNFLSFEAESQFSLELRSVHHGTDTSVLTHTTPIIHRLKDVLQHSENRKLKYLIKPTPKAFLSELVLIANLTRLVSSERKAQAEELPRSNWPTRMSMGDCLDY